MGAEEEVLWVQLLWEQVKGAQGGSWSDLPTAFGTTYAVIPLSPFLGNFWTLIPVEMTVVDLKRVSRLNQIQHPVRHRHQDIK